MAAVLVATAAGAWWLRPLPSRAEQLRAEVLEPRFETLKPQHVPPPKPQPGDWLAENPEPGQSFAEYVKSNPVRPTAAQRTIYLQPIGNFTAVQLEVIAHTADAVHSLFQLPVTTLPALSTDVVVKRRGDQLLTTAILEDVLIPRRPADALAMLGLTADDLYPGDGWNFVFGEASTVERVGVWSLFRNGEPGTPLYLERTVKTATHELGHMLSMQHCIAWACLMNGSNSLEEADLQPASLCPVCQQKLRWNISGP